MENKNYRILELYSGIGGMHYAWKGTGIKGEVVAAVDINTVANCVYKHNFGDKNLMNRNIQSITADAINKLNAQVILMSPPCQPFTRNGLQKDCDDLRSDSFMYLLDIFKNLHTVEYVCLENVKGFEISNARIAFIETLNNCGFYYQEFLLTPLQFGIPNSRLRYYCTARKNKFTLQSSPSPEILYDLPETTAMKNIQISSLISEKENNDNTYRLPVKFMKRALVLDIVYADSDKSCCFTKAYTHYLEGTGSVYTTSSREEVSRTFKSCSELDPQSKEYNDLIEKLNIRFFSPHEVSRLMAFPNTFTFPNEVTRKQCYRLLGNSINVKVVSEVIKFLILK